MQSVRRGILALVEVSKLALGHFSVDTAIVDKVLGFDAPTLAAKEEDDNNKEEASSNDNEEEDAITDVPLDIK
ncbi:hypothetical protein LTR12_018296 [Friedmanniomyces endolithicus]|nr:hypothetical protein LTR74_018594 [Friedmanniomyces endolithicus]KAK1807356.1 hypothetical protein LTR12_018296 [Friedmanniomyces endolithicus]